MKVVIDTNVYIAALIKKDSNAREILRLAFYKKIFPQISEPLFWEYEDVMKRNDIKKYIPLLENEFEELFQAFMSVCRWNKIYYLWRPNLKDEKDNFLIELAIASGAKTIITYNKKDFEQMQLSFDIEIAIPEEFIKKKEIL